MLLVIFMTIVLVEVIMDLFNLIIVVTIRFLMTIGGLFVLVI